MASTSYLRRAALLSLLTSAAHAALTYKGCFSSSQPLTDQGSAQYQTTSYCQPICVGKSQAVMGLSGGSDCWCGSQLPPADSLVSDSNCNSPCNGYGQLTCGGDGFYAVYLSGTSTDVTNYGGDSASSPSSPSSTTTAAAVIPATTATTATTPTPLAITAASSTTTTPIFVPVVAAPVTSVVPSIVTSVAPGTTVVVTMPATQQSDSTSATASSNSSGPNVGGIAAGVVVGVLALAAIIAGAIFYVRHRRRKQAEEGYQRSTQVSQSMRGNAPNTGYSNASDSRLDPEAGRRNSMGSIADSQDYSRRILRVANPDSH